MGEGRLGGVLGEDGHAPMRTEVGGEEPVRHSVQDLVDGRPPQRPGRIPHGHRVGTSRGQPTDQAWHRRHSASGCSPR